MKSLRDTAAGCRQLSITTISTRRRHRTARGIDRPGRRKLQQINPEGHRRPDRRNVEKARRKADRVTKGGLHHPTRVSGSLFAPIIINQPQTTILGVGKLEKRVVVREIGGQDAIQIRPMAYVSLTIDHRVVDGHQTNAWLSRFVEVLEGWPVD